MPVTETIQEILQGIDDAQYGRDMRELIHKGIQKCYEEGSAGETDLVARNHIDEVEADVEMLQDKLALNRWYNIPRDYGNSIINNIITNSNRVIINPFLKLMEISFYITGGSTNVEDVGILYKNLPIIENNRVYTQGINLRLHSERDVSLTKSNFTTTNIISCKIYNADANDSGDTTNYSSRTQSIVRYYGALAPNTTVYGHIIVPYVSLCSAHPMSEATIIDT